MKNRVYATPAVKGLTMKVNKLTYVEFHNTIIISWHLTARPRKAVGAVIVNTGGHLWLMFPEHFTSFIYAYEKRTHKINTATKNK